MRRCRGWLVVAVGGALALAGCGTSTPHNQPSPAAASRPSVYVDGTGHQGVLSASIGQGGFAALAPRHTPWQVSFGQYDLCVSRPGERAVILGVKPLVSKSAPPRSIALWMRTTTAHAVAATPPGKRQQYGSVTSLGAPPQWRDKGRTFFARGSWTHKIAGTVITTSCHAYGLEQDAVCNGKVPAAKIAHELVLTLNVGRSGAEVNGLDIAYRAGGRRSVLRVPWDMIACGTATRGPHRCQGHAS